MNIDSVASLNGHENISRRVYKVVLTGGMYCCQSVGIFPSIQSKILSKYPYFLR